jgi:hypothetical protein
MKYWNWNKGYYLISDKQVEQYMDGWGQFIRAL